ncbi:MAG: hypothetical protein AUG85_13630 [Gemmatimonadetes bacterium 13_1_20CM_4_66_11]|nr:MAG: hypothetical protein AUG85_13630 [Gemmatimonadetes bacterium 13_1_20CM_4_66_11]
MSNDGHSLDSSLVQGIAWTGGMRWSTQLVSWLVTLIVARLLGPATYGLVGMATLYVSFAQMISEAGLSAALIQQRGLTEDQVARLGGVALVLGVGFAAISLALSTPIAWFFGEPSVRWIIMALSATFLTRGLQVLPRSLLARDLEFRKLAWIDGFEAVTVALMTLVLAVLGLRVWALVLGTLLGNLATSLLCLRWRPHRLAPPGDFASLEQAVTFGWHVAGSRIAWYLYSNADFAVVGRVLGKAALGAYAFGWDIASVPVERVSALVGNVTPPFFAAVNQDPAALRRYLSGLTEGLGLVTLPACVGLALVAREFVLSALGGRWLDAVMPLRLLALYAGFRSIVTLTPQILVFTGHAKRNMQFSVLAVAVLPGVFYLGSHWGTTGVALGWITAYPLLYCACFVRSALRIVGMSWRAYGSALWPAVSTTGVMTLAVLALRAALPATWSPGLRLAALGVTGATAYGAVLYAAYGDRVRGVLDLLRGQPGRRTGNQLAVAES